MVQGRLIQLFGDSIENADSCAGYSSNAFASFMVGSDEMAPSCVVDKAPTAFPRHSAFSITSLFHVRSPSSKPASMPATKPSPAPVVSTEWIANPGIYPWASAVTYVQPALP